MFAKQTSFNTPVALPRGSLLNSAVFVKIMYQSSNSFFISTLPNLFTSPEGT